MSLIELKKAIENEKAEFGMRQALKNKPLLNPRNLLNTSISYGRRTIQNWIQVKKVVQSMRSHTPKDRF
jgi:hypothetical protein